jgi:hypothetical protein
VTSDEVIMKTNDCENGEEIDYQAVYDEMCSHSFLFPARRQDSPKPGPDFALGRMTDSRALMNDETNVKMTACVGLVAVYSNSVLFREHIDRGMWSVMIWQRGRWSERCDRMLTGQTAVCAIWKPGMIDIGLQLDVSHRQREAHGLFS